MFGADTELVFGAMQMAAITAGVTGGAVYLLMRRKRNEQPKRKIKQHGTAKRDLEERVRVLERIATDPAKRLADEFEELERADKGAKDEREKA